MNSYEDFLLNEIVGMAGLDNEQMSEVLKEIDDLRKEQDADLPQKSD